MLKTISNELEAADEEYATGIFEAYKSGVKKYLSSYGYDTSDMDSTMANMNISKETFSGLVIDNFSDLQETGKWKIEGDTLSLYNSDAGETNSYELEFFDDSYEIMMLESLFNTETWTRTN